MKAGAIAYIAFLRGIGPGDPRKSNESLRKVFESCGFENVRSFISSGNILFESGEKDAVKLEKKVEKAFRDTHGIEVATFIRTKAEIETFLETAPFGKRKHSSTTYLIVTFLKKGVDAKALEAVLKDKKSGVGSYDKNLNALCNSVDTTASKTPDFMQKLEKLLGKEITTRTINTVERIAKR
jgi:uncharacterized protein (DUF1697 family)